MTQLRNAVRAVLEQELQPRVDEHERNGTFPSEPFRELCKLGLASPMLPEPWGLGSVAEQVIVAEEMARVSGGFALSALASIGLFGNSIAKLGSQEQKEKFLPLISSGEKIGCWAVTEPEVGSDALSIKTSAIKRGGKYFLNGSKTLITNAPIADFFIIICREYGAGIEGGSAFIIERGARGLQTSPPLEKLGHHCSPTGKIFLEDVEGVEMLGKPGGALIGMKQTFQTERVILSALALGMMNFCIENVVRYSIQRKQFGRELAQHQLIQEKIAEMESKRELLRTYLYDLAPRVDRGKDVNREASIVKYLGSKYCFEVANDAVQVLGGYGYMREYGVERCLRDAKLLEIGGGTSEIQKLIIAKQVIKEMM